MKKQNYRSIDSYDLSDYKEVTGNDLYKINGGKEIENSIAAQAEAQPEDTLITSFADINYDGKVDYVYKYGMF